MKSKPKTVEAPKYTQVYAREHKIGILTQAEGEGFKAGLAKAGIKFFVRPMPGGELLKFEDHSCVIEV